MGARRPRDAGYATVEAALAIPSLLLFTLALAGVLAGIATQIRCVDAARIGARAAARGEPPAEVRAAVARASPDSTVRVAKDDGLVHVTVTAPVAAAPMLRAFTVHAEAVEADEAALGAGTDAGPAP
jgi:hypothetical protein